MSYTNEQELLCAIASGDQDAYRYLFNNSKDKVYSYAVHFTRSTFIAEEITQEVFVKLWVGRDTLTDINNIEAWMATITRNLCFNYLKKKALELKVKTAVTAKEDTATENVEEYILYKDQLSMLQLAMEQLSPQQRMIFRLNRENGLKNDEIARQLNITPNTVKTHMVTALRKIRQFMESHPASIFLPLAIFLKIIFK
ncbi:MAG: RNA polymerase sigma-70 factor [Ferruginibacter sp.]